LKIWRWLVALRTRKIYEPAYAPRHLYLCGRPNTRKSSFASYLQAGYRTFLTNVADGWWDGYDDTFDVAIIDEFTVIDPNRGGKCIVTLNRFMESARGQPLPIKYSGASKFNTTMPVVVISNLTRDAMKAMAFRYFDESQIAAFERRFTFADIGSNPLPLDFTYINMLYKKTDFSCQMDAVADRHQQFALILNICGVTIKLWLVVVSENTAKWFFQRHGIQLSPTRYTAIHMTRGAVHESMHELIACIEEQGRLPWVSYKYTRIEETYSFTFDTSELEFITHDGLSFESQFNSFPAIKDVDFMVFEKTIIRVTETPSPVWFSTTTNMKLFYALVRSSALLMRTSAFTEFAPHFGTLFMLANRIEHDFVCPICLMPSDSHWIVGRCVHPIHWKCLASYIETGNFICPLCRQQYTAFDDEVTVCPCDECAQAYRTTGLTISHNAS
jgi:hypothetical protein